MWIGPTYIEERTAVDDLVDLIVGAGVGWTVAREFWKVRVSRVSPVDAPSYYQIRGRSKHIILQKGAYDFLGFAQVSTQGIKLGLTDEFPTIEDRVAAIQPYIQEPFQEMQSLTVYMLKKLPDANTNLFYKDYNDLIEDDVDIEHYRVAPDYEYVVDPNIMQSPYCNLNFRNLTGNWWPDSKITVEGSITSKHIFLSLVSDTAPAWENNVIPTIPLFYGEIDSFDPNDTEDNRALFGGNFQFSNTVQMPYGKTYPTKPSNGIRSVMVRRGIRGAYYQAHYLSWNTAPNLMPEKRDDYPRAWHGRHDHPTYLTQFNPSRYTNKVHTSCLYVMHPEEGVRGKLADVLAVSPVGLMNGDKLIVNEGEEAGTYRFLLFEGQSVLNHQPANHFEPMGVAMKISP